MKLLTTIKPRGDGSVVLAGDDGREHFFVPDAAGNLVCEVPDEALVVRLLAAGNFEPADEVDFEKAESMLVRAGLRGKQVDDDDANDDDPGDDDLAGAGPPLEANTPPRSAPNTAAARAAKKARARAG